MSPSSSTGPLPLCIVRQTRPQTHRTAPAPSEESCTQQHCPNLPPDSPSATGGPPKGAMLRTIPQNHTSKMQTAAQSTSQGLVCHPSADNTHLQSFSKTPPTRCGHDLQLCHTLVCLHMHAYTSANCAHGAAHDSTLTLPLLATT